ncbi:helix-turn-helix domain-containing protein [Desulfitobacterium chlororespirans]|uniref:DNA binding domain-containing protein, excisionase family n=1 Tax=Desulfitobacterium chlororespirans DSM 11544 TaxID=1121395 RepID=A0A1M7UYI9_9FIRM|nr:helix-turn-helix domain-containing protein [Desulfitobacterium chlororespirans]SHN87990.1 DNA binding domain-containing protein, excisionase family [Desulfitobacterium chlororespirans DSM 11544]
MEKIQTTVEPKNAEIKWENQPLILSVEQLAGLLEVGEHQIYNLARTKDFPARRFGRIIKISRDAFRQWMGEEINKPVEGGWQSESSALSIVRQTPG